MARAMPRSWRSGSRPTSSSSSVVVASMSEVSPRSHARRRCRRRAADTASGSPLRAGHLEPLAAVGRGVVDEAGQPGGPGGDGEEGEVVVDHRQPGLGQLQGLVGGALIEVLLAPPPGGVDEYLFVAGPFGVERDGGEVAGAGLAERVEREAVQPSLLPTQQVVGDRLTGEGMAEGEDVLLLLDQ